MSASLVPSGTNVFERFSGEIHPADYAISLQKQHQPRAKGRYRMHSESDCIKETLKTYRKQPSEPDLDFHTVFRTTISPPALTETELPAAQTDGNKRLN